MDEQTKYRPVCEGQLIFPTSVTSTVLVYFLSVPTSDTGTTTFVAVTGLSPDPGGLTWVDD